MHCVCTRLASLVHPCELAPETPPFSAVSAPSWEDGLAVELLAARRSIDAGKEREASPVARAAIKLVDDLVKVVEAR